MHILHSLPFYVSPVSPVLFSYLRRLVNVYLFLLSGRRFNHFDLCKCPVVHIVQDDSRTIVFLQSDPIDMADIKSPGRQLLMLRELRISLRHFRNFIQFVQPNFSIQRVTTTRIDDLDILDRDIRNLVIRQADNAGRRDITRIIFRRPFVVITCIRFRRRDFGINIRDMHVVHPAATSLTTFSHDQIDRISGIDGTKAVHHYILNQSAINRLDRYSRTEREGRRSRMDNVHISNLYAEVPATKPYRT